MTFTRKLSRRAAVVSLFSVAACSISNVKFLGLDDELAEDCAKPGDEDGNGQADCDDAACAGLPACMVARPTCGDGKPEAPEACDDGNRIDGDGCDNNCTETRCGNGVPTAGEACDDGNQINGDACDNDCKPPRCGNGLLDPSTEQCDGGGVPTQGCKLDCQKSVCGDGVVDADALEERDPPNSPVPTVPVNPTTCRYDFSAITQLYCTGNCGKAWAGGSATGCSQAAADAFCRLKTGNPASVAMPGFMVVTALATPGLCCPIGAIPASCKPLGTFAGRGVDVPVYIDNVDLLASNGPGSVIVNPTCMP